MARTIIDAWLLRRFPGRMLEELDRMDWPRYLRAVEVMQIQDVEAQRTASINHGGIDKLPPAVFKVILQHDRLLREFGLMTNGD